MELGTYSSSDAANRISLDGVTYDISNLLLKANVTAAEQTMYPLHLIPGDDDEIVLNESHCYRNSLAKQTCLHATESLGLDNVFNTSRHREDNPQRWSNHGMHDSNTSSLANDRSQRGSYEAVEPRRSGDRRALLSYRDEDDDDSVCGGYNNNVQDPVRNIVPSPAASPRGRVHVTSNRRDSWGQSAPLKTPYEDLDGLTAKSMGAKAASNEKLSQLYKDNNDSDTSMGVESLMIEIMPGLSEPLRGSAETIKAHMSGNIMRIHCVCCDQDISCVGDAAYVLCPNCTVVSPAPSESMNGSSWGVGLGFLADQFHADDNMLSRSSSLAESYSRNF